jgi:hypothetical protein
MAPCGTAENDSAWCNVLDPPGLVMAFVAWAMTLYCLAAVAILGVSFGWPDAVLGVYGSIAALALWSHAATMASDPGAVPRAGCPLPTAQVVDIFEKRCVMPLSFQPQLSLSLSLNSHQLNDNDATMMVMVDGHR